MMDAWQIVQWAGVALAVVGALCIAVWAWRTT